MGSIWLTDLADVCRATGLTVGEVDGWRIRSRSSGGFDAVLGASAHHTASNPATDGAPDVRYITNLYLDRGGQVWVIAAGATNTCGKGGPWLDIGQDQANRTTIGVEMANNGVGEPWPAVQQHAAVTLYRAIWSHYGARFGWTDPRRIFAHKEWAPGRKIDPAGPSMWATSAGIWDMDAFRDDVTASHPIAQPLPPPVIPDTPSEVEVPFVAFWKGIPGLVIYGATGWRWAKDQADIDLNVFLGLARYGPGGTPLELDPATMKAPEIR